MRLKVNESSVFGQYITEAKKITAMETALEERRMAVTCLLQRTNEPLTANDLQYIDSLELDELLEARNFLAGGGEWSEFLTRGFGPHGDD